MQRNAVYILVGSVLALVVLGIVMLFSTSAFAHDSRGDMYYFVRRQMVWLVVAFVVAVTAAVVNYDWWKRTWWCWYVLAVVLLILCFIPPIGMKINGSWRWINLGFMAFQPSELAKIAAIFFLAWWFTRFEKDASRFWQGFVAPMAVVGVLLGLIVAEVDLGTTALIGAVMLAVMFAGGSSLIWLGMLAVGGLGAAIYLAMNIQQRAGRILAFMDPEKYRLDEGLQQFQALIALGSGGFNGLGLGEGRQKMLYLPYAHTDFIFPMIGEELGLRFTLLTVGLYLLICLSGGMIAQNARDRFGMLVAWGAVLLISLQAVVNIGVTTSLLPNKGMPLPFISYGGSNLVMCMFLVGLLVNVHLQGRPAKADAPVSPFRRRLSHRMR